MAMLLRKGRRYEKDRRGAIADCHIGDHVVFDDGRGDEGAGGRHGDLQRDVLADVDGGYLRLGALSANSADSGLWPRT